MLTLKKIFFNFTLISTILLSFSFFNDSLAQENVTANQDHLIKQIEQWLLQPSEDLIYQDVKKLSKQITLQRTTYPSDTISKTYLLLTSIALNKGELESAFQFAIDGLAISNINQQIQLRLQIKLAEVYLAQREYKKLLTMSQQVISKPFKDDQKKWQLIASGYLSVAYAMLSQEKEALAELQNVQQMMQQNPAFDEHIKLLGILANAYFHLNEFQTALAIQQKILSLRFNNNQLNGLGQTYYHLGNSYYQLHQFHDAYNTFWEAEEYAKKITAPIHEAYAKQGLALTLIKQKKYSDASVKLLAAQKIFLQHNLVTPYLETLISLAKINSDTDKVPESYPYLTQAEKIIKDKKLTGEFTIFYHMLAQMYFTQNQLNNAYIWQVRYSQALTKENKKKALVSRLDYPNYNTNNEAEELAEQSELTNIFSNKYQHQQIIIFLLSLLILVIILIQLFFWITRRAKQSTSQYDNHDKPNNILIHSSQAKQYYQTQFNMARKYSYPLTLGYISIDNWHELTFKFNKKTINEVLTGITELISQHLTEFESAGLINKDEYLLIFPHQTTEEASKTIDSIIQALKLQFFAHLGEFSVTLSHSIKEQGYQDIDPYIFLSQLTK